MANIDFMVTGRNAIFNRAFQNGRRVSEHGHAIHAAVLDQWHSTPVDVPEDVARVEASLRG